LFSDKEIKMSTDSLTDFEQKIERYDGRRNLFESFLVCSMQKGRKEFPTIEKFLLSELINGVVTYVGGKVEQVDYWAYYFGDGGLEEKLVKEIFQREMTEERRKKIQPKIMRAIDKMINYSYVSPSGLSFDTFPYCEVYGFAGDIFGVPKPISYLTDNVINRADEMLTSLKEQERENVYGIGRVMRPFIEQDIDYIKRVYFWRKF